MRPIRTQANPAGKAGGPAGRIRAIRFTDNRKECERRIQAFSLFAPACGPDSDAKFALRVARALRAERRAAQNGAGYDPMRHLALLRLDRRLRCRGRKAVKPERL